MPAPSEPELQRRFEALIERIEGHPRYGAAMRAAVLQRMPLVLDYHTHGGPGAYCISVRGKPADNPLKIFGQQDEMEELVHIKEFGPSESECIPLSIGFGEALKDHYGLEAIPEIYLNGKPYPASS